MYRGVRGLRPFFAGDMTLTGSPRHVLPDPGGARTADRRTAAEEGIRGPGKWPVIGDRPGVAVGCIQAWEVAAELGSRAWEVAGDSRYTEWPRMLERVQRPLFRCTGDRPMMSHGDRGTRESRLVWSDSRGRRGRDE